MEIPFFTAYFCWKPLNLRCGPNCFLSLVAFHLPGITLYVLPLLNNHGNLSFFTNSKETLRMTARAIIVQLNFLIYMKTGNFCRACDPMGWVIPWSKWPGLQGGMAQHPHLPRKMTTNFPQRRNCSNTFPAMTLYETEHHHCQHHSQTFSAAWGSLRSTVAWNFDPLRKSI